MTPRRLADTNLILRHLVQDDEHHARIAAKLFAASDRGSLVLVILPVVLVECVFVLESFYQKDRHNIALVLSALITGPGIELQDLPIYFDALRRYASARSHIVDCTLAATAAAQKLPIATFDQGYKRFKDVTVDLH